MTFLKISDTSPQFTASSTKGLIDLQKIPNSFIVLYFYPKDLTPGCTIQAKEFTALYDAFRSLDAEIIGVSKDSMSRHERFQEKENIPYPLLLDEDQKICQKYGVISEKNMFGKKYLGINRTTFLIDKEKKIIKIWKQVKASGHAQIVLDRIKTN